MKRHWTTEELQPYWRLLLTEKKLVKGRGGGMPQLGFSVLLKFFENEGRFPQHRNEIPTEAISYLAQQLEMSADEYRGYNWGGPQSNVTARRSAASGSSVCPITISLFLIKASLIANDVRVTDLKISTNYPMSAFNRMKRYISLVGNLTYRFISN